MTISEIKPGETVEVKVQYPPVSAKEDLQIIERWVITRIREIGDILFYEGRLPGEILWSCKAVFST